MLIYKFGECQYLPYEVVDFRELSLAKTYLSMSP